MFRCGCCVADLGRKEECRCCQVGTIQGRKVDKLDGDTVSTCWRKRVTRISRVSERESCIKCMMGKGRRRRSGLDAVNADTTDKAEAESEADGIKGASDGESTQGTTSLGGGR